MPPPYRKHEEPPKGDDEKDKESPSPKEKLGLRLSSHARKDTSGTIGTLLGRERAVDLHTNGLVVWNLLGKRAELLFSEIDAVRYRFDGSNSDTPSVALSTFDGLNVDIPASVTGIEQILADIDREVTRPLIEPAKEALARGERLVFGPLVLELDGILLRDRRLPWAMLPRVIARRDSLAFHAPDTHGRFGILPLGEVPHPRVLLAVLRMRTRVVLQGLRLFGEHDE